MHDDKSTSDRFEFKRAKAKSIFFVTMALLVAMIIIVRRFPAFSATVPVGTLAIALWSWRASNNYKEIRFENSAVYAYSHDGNVQVIVDIVSKVVIEAHDTLTGTEISFIGTTADGKKQWFLLTGAPIGFTHDNLQDALENWRRSKDVRHEKHL